MSYVIGTVKGISIHSTTRVETIDCGVNLSTLVYFNPLHHEGGDRHRKLAGLQLGISIHSTTRVETYAQSKTHNDVRKFQSTPPRGWRHILTTNERQQ